MSYEPKVYRRQGGDELVVADGGNVDVEDGGTITLEDGESLVIEGTPFRHGGLHLSNALQAVAQRYTLDQIKAGQTLITPAAGEQWQVVDVKLRAIGGAAGVATHITMAEEDSGNLVFKAPIAALTQDTWVTPDTAGVISTYLGVWSTIGKELIIGDEGGVLAGLTHLDVLVIYVH